jgi:hypothetical protein
MSTVFQTSARIETFKDLGQARWILEKGFILKNKSMSRMMTVLFVQETINA